MPEVNGRKLISALPDVLYHYCSMSAFKGIIESKSIWLTDVQRSNDSEEIRWIYKNVPEYVNEELEVYGKALDAGPKETDEERTKRLSETLISTYVTRNGLPTTDNTTEAFCLSENGDLLSQWRGYADDGRGISIGFSTQLLAVYHRRTYAGLNANQWQKNSQMGTAQNLCLQAVNYHEATKEWLKVLIPLDFHNGEILNEVIRKLIALSWYAPLYKNPAFKEESEWRLFLQMPDDVLKESTKGKKLSLPQYEKAMKQLVSDSGNFEIEFDKFLVSNDDIIRYIELKFQHPEKMISEIILGPKCKASEKNVRSYLRHNGFINDDNENDVKIRRSSATYR